MSARRLLAALLSALMLVSLACTPSHAWWPKKAVKIGAGVVAADYALVAGAAFVETNIALRSIQFGSAAVQGLARLLAAHPVFGPRAVYSSLAKRILENPALFTRAVQVVRMIGLEDRLLSERIQQLADAGTGGPEQDPEDECDRPGNDNPYRPRRIADDVANRFMGPDPGAGPASNTLPDSSHPNVAKSIASPNGLEIHGVPFDERGFPIFDHFSAADLRVTDRAAFFRPGVKNRDQLKMATLELRKLIVEERSYTGLKKEYLDIGEFGYTGKFNAVQLQEIMDGNHKIPGYVWHHHQDPARMQLVQEEVHKSVRHVGGWSMNRCRH